MNTPDNSTRSANMVTALVAVPANGEVTDEQIEAAAGSMVGGEVRKLETVGNMTGTVCCTRS